MEDKTARVCLCGSTTINENVLNVDIWYPWSVPSKYIAVGQYTDNSNLWFYIKGWYVLGSSFFFQMLSLIVTFIQFFVQHVLLICLLFWISVLDVQIPKCDKQFQHWNHADSGHIHIGPKFFGVNPEYNVPDFERNVWP